MWGSVVRSNSTINLLIMMMVSMTLIDAVRMKVRIECLYQVVFIVLFVYSVVDSQSNPVVSLYLLIIAFIFMSLQLTCRLLLWVGWRQVQSLW
jgi:hypothetical protein